MCLFFSCPKLHSISFPHHILVDVLIKLKNDQSHMIDRCTFPRIALLAVLSPHPWYDTLTPRHRDTSHRTSAPVSEFRCLRRQQQPHFTSAARASTRNHLLVLSSSSPLRSKHPVDPPLHTWLGNQQKNKRDERYHYCECSCACICHLNNTITHPQFLCWSPNFFVRGTMPPIINTDERSHHLWTWGLGN